MSPTRCIWSLAAPCVFRRHGCAATPPWPTPVHRQGSVPVQRGGVDLSALAIGASLRAGDQILTGEQSTLTLRFIDGSRLLVSNRMYRSNKGPSPDTKSRRRLSIRACAVPISRCASTHSTRSRAARCSRAAWRCRAARARCCAYALHAQDNQALLRGVICCAAHQAFAGARITQFLPARLASYMQRSAALSI